MATAETKQSATAAKSAKAKAPSAEPFFQQEGGFFAPPTVQAAFFPAPNGIQRSDAPAIQRAPGPTTPAPAAGVTAASPPPPSGNAGMKQARLPAPDNSIPSIGPAPVDSYDYTVTLAKNQTLIEAYATGKNWTLVDKEFTLFNFPTDIGVVLSLGGHVQLGASFGVVIGPLMLRNVKVGLTKEQYHDLEIAALETGALGLGGLGLGGLAMLLLLDFKRLAKLAGIKRYFGEATLDFQAIISGGFKFDAGLEADASFAKLIKLAVVTAGIRASADASVQARASSTVYLDFVDGEMNFDKFLDFQSDFDLHLLLEAYLKAKVLGWEFDLSKILFQKDYTKELFEFTLGTPFKVNSKGGTPKADVDIPAAIDKVRDLMSHLQNATTMGIHGDRKDAPTTLGGTIQPPTGIIPASGNLLPYDSTLGLNLSNERAGLGYSKFQDFMGTNVATFKYSILEVVPAKTRGGDPTYKETGETGYESAPNRTGEHSESMIIGRLQALQKGYKKGQYALRVTHVLSERKPCSNCQAYLDQNNPMVKTKGSSVFYLVPYLARGRNEDPYLENLRSLIKKYGLTPPTLEAMKQELHPAKPQPGTK